MRISVSIGCDLRCTSRRQSRRSSRPSDTLHGLCSAAAALASTPACSLISAGVKVDFNALKAPAGYVPGMGRGAAGFTTRSDIGPSMPAPDVQQDKKVRGGKQSVAGCRAGGLGSKGSGVRLSGGAGAGTAATAATGCRPCPQPRWRSTNLPSFPCNTVVFRMMLAAMRASLMPSWAMTPACWVPRACMMRRIERCGWLSGCCVGCCQLRAVLLVSLAAQRRRL